MGADANRPVNADWAAHSGAWAVARALAISLFLSGELLLEILHDSRLAQRGHVAQLAALGDVAQQPAHDLSRAGFGNVRGPDDALGTGEPADPPGHLVAHLLLELLVALEITLKNHECRDRLARVLVGLAYHRRLGHLRMGHDRRLHLRRGEQVPRDVDGVVRTAHDPEVAVLVPTCG